MVDLDATSCRVRLSYRRAAEVFEQHTTYLEGGPYTTHQLLRHSGLTHASEVGASTPTLIALSGHISVRALAKYAPGVGRVARRQQAATVGLDRDQAGAVIAQTDQDQGRQQFRTKVVTNCCCRSVKSLCGWGRIRTR